MRIHGRGGVLELLATRLTSNQIDGAIACRADQPRARLVGDAVHPPVLECRQGGILSAVFGALHVAEQSNERRDDPRPLGVHGAAEALLCSTVLRRLTRRSLHLH